MLVLVWVCSSPGSSCAESEGCVDNHTAQACSGGGMGLRIFNDEGMGREEELN